MDVNQRESSDIISRRPKKRYVADSEWQRTRRQKQRTGPLKIENPCLLTYQCRCDHTYIHEDIPIHWVRFLHEEKLICKCSRSQNVCVIEKLSRLCYR